MSKAPKDDGRSNRLLDALEPASRQRIDAHLESIKLKLGTVVCEAGGLLKHAYFPQGNVLSLLTVLEDGSAIETANIGREGAFGLFAAMYSRVSFNRCLVQLEGAMVRCPIQLLQSEFKHSEHVRDLFVSYSETLLSRWVAKRPRRRASSVRTWSSSENVRHLYPDFIGLHLA